VRAEFLISHPSRHGSANYLGARMSDRTDWLRGLSTKELVFVHKVYEAINQSTCETIESHRAAGEIRQELCRRARLARLEKDFEIG
jgi:hypothetical protein